MAVAEDRWPLAPRSRPYLPPAGTCKVGALKPSNNGLELTRSAMRNAVRPSQVNPVLGGQ